MMLCIKIYSKYCAIVKINEKTNNDLALGFIKCMNDMGGPPKVIVTDGEGAINNGGLVQKKNSRKSISHTFHREAIQYLPRG